MLPDYSTAGPGVSSPRNCCEHQKSGPAGECTLESLASKPIRPAPLRLRSGISIESRVASSGRGQLSAVMGSGSAQSWRVQAVPSKKIIPREWVVWHRASHPGPCRSESFASSCLALTCHPGWQLRTREESSTRLPQSSRHLAGFGGSQKFADVSLCAEVVLRNLSTHILLLLRLRPIMMYWGINKIDYHLKAA
jgi:hypothetical protein